MHILPQKGVFVLEKFGGLGFKFYENVGVAFGLPLPAALMYILVIGILVVLLYLLAKKIMLGEALVVFSLGLVVAGAFSNLYDRLAYGYVVDFINIFIWPTFNLADLMIVGGLLCWVLLERRRTGDRG